MSKRPLVGPEINKPSGRAPLLVGRDPGSEESDRGRPYVGSAGRLLFGGYDNYTGQHSPGVVAHSGMMREDFNITNTVQRQPWNNDFNRHSNADIEEGRKSLFALIDQLQPSVIVATGAQACWTLIPSWRTLTDKHSGDNSGGATARQAKGILDRRGFFWYPEETGLPCPILATLHPASCLYQAMPNRLLLDIDFQRLGAHMRGDLVRRTWPEPIRITNRADLEPVWQSDLVAYDIEITWGGDKFLCMGLYTAEGQAFLAYGDALGACVDWLRSDRPKLTHNGQFDRYYLEHHCGIPVGGHHEDTICAHWACYPELAGKEDTGREDQRKSGSSTMTRKGLNFLASFHLDVPWWKTYTSDPALMGQLCINDVAATMWNWEIIKPELDNMGVRPQYERQLAMLPALIAIQARGFRIDEDMRQRRIDELSARQSTLEDQSRQAALAFLQAHNITHRPDGSEYWWYHDARCECCFGGDIKRAHCDVCAGVTGTGANGSILKKDLVLALWRGTSVPPGDLKAMKKDELVQLLPPCEACGGAGAVPVWDFNPMSDTQMPALLWEHLDIPKYVGTPRADEETLRKVLEWADD